MAVSKITVSPRTRWHTTYSTTSGTTSLAAGSTVDITTAWDLTGRDVIGLVPMYAGNPKLVITNLWTANNRACFTVLNPTSSTQTITHARATIGVLYRA